MTKPITPPETLILGLSGGWKAEYRLFGKDNKLIRSRAMRVAQELRRKHGWRIKVKKFGDYYYLYMKTESRRKY